MDRRAGSKSTASSSAGPSLFEAQARRDPHAAAAMPLAERVRPESLREVVGQRHIIGDDKPLARAIAADRLGSMILWGPPGAGKTTIARAMAASTQARFVPFSAVLGGVADVRRIVAEAQDWRAKAGRRTILFVDEIHRFNKAQQDAFLPHVENGTVVLIGATTENPSFSLNAPLLSRCIVHQLEPLEPAALVELLARALNHPRGFAGAMDADEAALQTIAAAADGDGRKALQLLEWAAEHAKRSGLAQIDRELVQQLGTDKTLRYDRSGEEHYNVVSAFIKSMRGSDPDAAVYWLMRMIDAGDDPLFVSRRMIIFAGEDIGTADPRALAVAVDADRAFRRIGLPEGIYALAEAAIYLACAPKSNACTLAWHRARQAIAEHGSLAVPRKLRNATTGLLRELGYGQGYRYPHDEAGAVAAGENYLPEQLVGQRFYEPSERGLEQAIGQRLRRLRGEREADK